MRIGSKYRDQKDIYAIYIYIEREREREREREKLILNRIER